MILRVVRGRIRPGMLDDVMGVYRRDYVPIAERTPGLERYAIAVQAIDDGHALAAMTVWATIDSAMRAYGGDLEMPRTLDGRKHGEEMTDVDYYEVEPGGVHRRPGAPALLRLTSGTVTRGLDADIQQELRRRLPSLPPEALEAYVGRRVQGTEVEIAFVSTWAGTPGDASLEEPIWPEISGRYDTFRVELFDILVDGSPGTG